MVLHNHCKLILLLLICLDLCTHSIPSENSSIVLHDQVVVHVGIILDMETWIVKSIHSFITMAISDFYALNYKFSTKIVFHTRDSKGDPLQAVSAVLDLLNNVKVQAIIGPETYLEAKLLAPIADKAKVPIFSFVDTPPTDYQYLFQITSDKSILFKTIITLVESFKWKDVIFLYEDADCGGESLSHFLESLQDKSIRVSLRSAVPAMATNDQITQELQKIKISYTRVIIVHMPSLLASRFLLIAKRLQMVSERYTWIVTYTTLDILQSVDNEVIESLPGMICVRPYIPASRKLLNLTARWYKEWTTKYPTSALTEVSVLAIWAYDTVWALAESIQKVGVQSSLAVPQFDSMLLHKISKSTFQGLSGEFRFFNRKLVSNGFKIVNVIGNGNGRGSTISPKRRILQSTSDKKLKVGVLARKKFSYFIDTYYDDLTNITIASGFSVDVFNTCIHALPFDVSYELVPYTNGSYNDLVKKVYDQVIDAILGDTTILENRSHYVDFTATYTDLGVGMLTRINHNDMWIFLKPLDVDLWLGSIVFAILTGFTIWAIESMNKGSQISPAKQIGSTFWLLLMTLFFAQRDRLSSNLSKFVVFVWLLVVLILISSYTATFASLLTVEQLKLAAVTISNVHFGDYRGRPYYSYEEYADALSRGGKHGGADAIIDEIPYIKMFLGKYSADYAMILREDVTSGFGFVSTYLKHYIKVA
uniref:glutamate receptor 1.4-like n=1 Tax=Erigeron canadensis TaxID=72917 RepID=UPI001CB90E7C